MLYLLDANVLIRAHEDYYPLDRIPQFWDWLTAQASAGRVKMPLEIHDEIATGTGVLKDWITSRHVKNELILPEEVDSTLLNHVLNTAYGPNLTDQEHEQVGRDPFLVAYGLMGKDRVIVTKEVPKPSKSRGNRKVPDACDSVEVPWTPDFKFYRDLDFRIR